MVTDSDETGSRGQAFTLEGFIASIVVLTAVVFALQAVVITPTTSGAIDQETQRGLRAEANDILATNAYNGSDGLVDLVLFWNGTATERTWAFGRSEQIGYGSQEPATGWGPDVAPEKKKQYLAIGDVLNESFRQRGRIYNLEVEYRDPNAPNGSETLPIVFRGVPSDNAVSTTYTVVLYDEMTLTGPGNPAPPLAAPEDTPCNDVPIEAISPVKGRTETGDSAPTQFGLPRDEDCYYPIPDAFNEGGASNPPGEPYDETDSEVYNIVEVRLTVW
jgi:hypothetical protein